MLVTTDVQKAALSGLLILASPEIMMSVGYSGQDEITYVCFFVVSLYFYLKGKFRSSYAWMVLAVSCCPLMLMPALAMLLIKEKNVFKLIPLTVGLLSPLFLFELYYRNDMTYQTAKTANDFAKMMSEMLGATTVSTALGEISIAGFLLVFLYFGCYCMKADDTVESRKKVLYLTAVIFVNISFLMANGFYRLFLYVPFLVILLLVSGQDLPINMFLLMVLTYGRTLFACYRNCPDNMNTYCIMKDSWITDLCDRVGSGKYAAGNASCLYHYLEGRNMTPGLMILAATCTTACIVLLLVINNPRFHRRIGAVEGMGTSVCIALYSMCTPLILMLFYIILLH